MFIKIQSEEKKSLDDDREEKKCFGKAQVENGISRFISQFNVSIQNEDDEKS